MKPFRTTACFAIFSLAGPALGLDFGSGFSMSGDVELEWISQGSVNSTAILGEAKLGWRSQGGGPIGIGFDVNPIGFSIRDPEFNASTVWGGVVLTTGIGDLTFGRPRPLFDTWSHAPVIGSAKSIDIGLSQIDGSFVGHAELVFGNTDIKGIAFTGGDDSFSYGAAYHEANPLGFKAKVAELTVGYRLGQTKLYGGLEQQKLALLSSATYRLFLGAEYSADVWTAGFEVITTRSGGQSRSIYTLFGTYQIGDRLTVSGQLRDLSEISASGALYGIGAEYSLGTGSYAQMGLLGDDAGSDTTLTASVGFRF